MIGDTDQDIVWTVLKAASFKHTISVCFFLLIAAK